MNNANTLTGSIVKREIVPPTPCPAWGDLHCAVLVQSLQLRRLTKLGTMEYQDLETVDNYLMDA